MKPTGLPKKPRPNNVVNVVHDPITNELTVTFHNGHRYVYHDVPAKTYTQMMEAPSKGSFLHNNIKPKHMARKLPK